MDDAGGCQIDDDAGRDDSGHCCNDALFEVHVQEAGGQDSGPGPGPGQGNGDEEKKGNIKAPAGLGLKLFAGGFTPGEEKGEFSRSVAFGFPRPEPCGQSRR